MPSREDVRPPVIRVLLQTDASPSLPEPGRRYAAVVGGRTVVIRGPLAATLTAGAMAFQVGAFADTENADATLVRLRAAGFTAEVHTSADGLTRVVVTGAPTEAADQLRARLAAHGFAETRPVAAADRRVVLHGEGGAELVGDEVRLVPLDPQPVRVGDRSVRGELLVRPGGAGAALINVINLERYLRGVVPSEMGPRAFPALEALKAQAVAARTYAVAHLAEYADAGYDICDSQLCQVYGGADAEQPLTDRAVTETEGEIAVYAGKPIDAMYHSTCGGHTEDAAAVFPERAAPYLKGVACRTEGVVVVGGASASRSDWFSSLERLARVGEALAAALTVPARPALLAARLGGHPAPAGVAGLAAAFGLPDLAPLRHDGDVHGYEQQILATLATFRLPLSERPAATNRTRWELALVVRLGQLSGAVRIAPGYLVPGPAGARLVNEKGESVQELAAAAQALERRGEAWRSGAVAVPVGSPATAWCAGDACPLVEVEPRSEADGASSWSWWARELPRDEIARRFAFPPLEDVVVTRRGVSGRALTVALRGGGAAREVAGYAFRRALELPDTLFVVQRRATPQGEAVRFLGRGWGHGVGMCQNGAFGKALAGLGYREILASYYTGTDVVRWAGAGGQ